MTPGGLSSLNEHKENVGRGFFEDGIQTQWYDPKKPRTKQAGINLALGERIIQEMDKSGMERPKGVERPPAGGELSTPQFAERYGMASEVLQRVKTPAFMDQ